MRASPAQNLLHLLLLTTAGKILLLPHMKTKDPLRAHLRDSISILHEDTKFEKILNSCLIFSTSSAPIYPILCNYIIDGPKLLMSGLLTTYTIDHGALITYLHMTCYIWSFEETVVIMLFTPLPYCTIIFTFLLCLPEYSLILYYTNCTIRCRDF